MSENRRPGSRLAVGARLARWRAATQNATCERSVPVASGDQPFSRREVVGLWPAVRSPAVGAPSLLVWPKRSGWSPRREAQLGSASARLPATSDHISRVATCPRGTVVGYPTLAGSSSRSRV
jgi:hypothetical protein